MIACMRLFRNKNKQNTTFILKCTSHLDFVSVNTNYFFKVSITEIFKRIGLSHVSFQTNPSFCNTMTPHKIQDNVIHSDVTYTLSLKRVYKSPAFAWSMSGWTLLPVATMGRVLALIAVLGVLALAGKHIRYKIACSNFLLFLIKYTFVST